MNLHQLTLLLCLLTFTASAQKIRVACIGNSIIYNYELPAIRQMAKKHHWHLIDLYKATDKMPEYFPDGIHPNPQGAAVIARKVKKAVKKEVRKVK